MRRLIFILFLVVGFGTLGMGIFSIAYLSKIIILKRDWIMMGIEMFFILDFTAMGVYHAY